MRSPYFSLPSKLPRTGFSLGDPARFRSLAAGELENYPTLMTSLNPTWAMKRRDVAAIKPLVRNERQYRRLCVLPDFLTRPTGIPGMQPSLPIPVETLAPPKLVRVKSTVCDFVQCYYATDTAKVQAAASGRHWSLAMRPSRSQMVRSK